MKNYLAHKDKYNKKFADAIMDVFRNKRYGITACHNDGNMDLITMRKELIDWQSSGDYSSFCDIATNYKKWLPINMCHDDVCYVNININNYNGVGKSFHITPASALWTLTHDLEFNPNVTTTDESGQEIQGTIVYVNDTTVNVIFSQPVAGWAYLS